MLAADSPLVGVLCADGAPLKDNHLLRTYHDQLHGWCATRGDRTKPRIANAVRAALQSTIEFVAEVVPDASFSYQTKYRVIKM